MSLVFIGGSASEDFMVTGIRNTFVVSPSAQNAAKASTPATQRLAMFNSDEFETRGGADGMVIPNRGGVVTGKTGAGSLGTVNVTNHGGQVLSNPVVTNMYLGDYFNSAQGQADVKHNDDFMNALVKDSGYMGVLSQYGVKGGSTQASQVIPGSFPSGKTITQKQIEQMLSDAITSGKASAGPQSVFNFVLPPGAVLKMNDGTSSKKGLGGFHNSISVNGQTVFYSAEAYSQGRNGIDFTNGNAQDNVSITESHELAEAASDPNGDAWFDDKNGEIGDIEVNDAAPGTPLSTMFGRLSNGDAIQKIWSQKDQTNEIAPA